MADTREPPPQYVTQNVESVIAMHRQEFAKLTGWERMLDQVGVFVGRPGFLIALCSGVSLWIAINVLAPRLGLAALDAPPFPLLHVFLAFFALATSTVVLIAQQRQARVESRKAHLDLQLSLLAERKASAIIRLLEDLRRDLPMVHDRHDAEASELQRPADTTQVLSALEGADVSGQLDPHPTARMHP